MINRYLLFILTGLALVGVIQGQVPVGYTWQEVANADFGTGVNRFTIQGASAASGGELELRLGTADGPVIGRVYFHHTGSDEYFMDYSCELTQTVTGVQDVYMNFLDYTNPVAGGSLFVGESAFEWEEDTLPDEGALYVYPPVPGLEPSPYYEFAVQKVSALNAENLADVTNWESPFAWFTQCRDDDPDGDNKGYYANFGIGGWSHTYTNFELDPNTPIVVKITRKSDTGDDAPSGPITSAAVHPVDNVDSMELINGEVYVTLRNPTQVTIDIDGQMDTRDAPRATAEGFNFAAFRYGNRQDGAHAVSIFANPVIADKPNPTDPDVLVVQAGEQWPPADINETYWNTLYFEPGIHRMSTDLNAQGELVERPWQPEDVITLEANKSYYIPGDAIVYGNFTDHFSSTESDNIRVFGHGTVSGSKIVHYKSHPDFPLSEYPQGMPGSDKQRALYLTSSSSSIYEGVTVVDPANHSLTISGTGTTLSTRSYLKWVKLIAWRENSDALSVGGNTFVEDCFLRTQDDGHYVGAVTIRRCIMWVDVNGIPFRCSFLTNHDRGIALLEDIDIIYARGTVFRRGGVVSSVGSSNLLLSNGVENVAQGVHFRNLNISDPRPQMSLLALDRSSDQCDSLAGIRFENVNVKYKSVFSAENKLLGSPDANIHNFVFDNLVIEDERVDAAYFYNSDNFQSSHVYDLTFRQTYVISPADYTLTTTAINGSVAVLPAGDGSGLVSVTATPISGYTFTGWSGDLSGASTTANITVNRDMAITATFEAVIPGSIEAESFAAQSGILTEACNEGGQNITSIHAGDWVEYEVGVADPGDYAIDLRVASGTGGGTVSFYSDDVFIASVEVPDTGGGQTWATLSTEINLRAAGPQTLRLSFSGGSEPLFNLNWIDFSYLGITAGQVPGKIEAESQISMATGMREGSIGSDVSYLQWIHDGRWAEYQINVNEAGSYRMSFRVASNKYGGSINILEDGVNIGSIDVPNSQGSTNFINVSTNVNFTSTGRKILRLEFHGNGEFLYNFDWMQFTLFEPVVLSIGNSIALAKDGATHQFSVPLLPPDLADESIIWFSDDISVATVDQNGLVTTGNVGSVTITALTSETGYYAQCEIAVLSVLPNQLDAVDFTRQSGIHTDASDEGGRHVSNINNGEWVEYAFILVEAGVYSVDIRAASNGSGGTIEILANGESIGNVVVPNTGGWQTWQTLSTEVTFSETGQQTLRLNFSSPESDYLFNLKGMGFNLLTPAELNALLESVFPDRRLSLQPGGLDAYLTLSSLRPTAGSASGQTFTHDGHSFRVEGSADLVAWDEVVEVVTNPEGLSLAPPGFEWVSYRLSTPIHDVDSAGSGFIRIKLLDAAAP